MNKDFTSLEDIWKKSKENLHTSDSNLNEIYKKIDTAKSENSKFYFGTIYVLLITLLVIISFFVFVAPVKDILSRLGASLMVVGLVARILIEVGSIVRLKRVQVYESTLETIDRAISFHKYRKMIHSVVMPIILVVYTIGYYMITPEFLMYLSLEMVVFYDVIYLIMIIFLFFQFRKGIRKEMKNLELTIALKKSISEG